ncbi:hypothetical protein [Thiohalophilus sp.]|uniref:hypothetical protein n=1 Tax=Thiohalophilus sp. TaxID=3028392 RepID=UPI002ACD5658|nr:hypothetical protein [Thiohalophilus sp.]MDZ7661874.1 hypothetical protein [Thiohalophilus sp.]MDZ7803739.1 hypothetical protein [Thiohalophilus sp.]
MSNDVLEQVTSIIETDPRSGQSLLLFALVSTLNVEKTGHMYMLGKLKEFTPENRQLAYGLMEMMADNRIHDEAWQAAMARMEQAVKG